jgi:hypothetical protein
MKRAPARFFDAGFMLEAVLEKGAAGAGRKVGAGGASVVGRKDHHQHSVVIAKERTLVTDLPTGRGQVREQNRLRPRPRRARHQAEASGQGQG